MKRAKSVSELIENAPSEARKKLVQMRACIKAAAPGATEGLKWGMPAYSYKRILVMYAPFKRHIGFFPTPSAVKAFAKQLSEYKFGKGSIQFPLDKPLPTALITKITKFRVKESVDKDKKWK